MADQKIIRKSGIAHYVVSPARNSFYLIYSAASQKIASPLKMTMARVGNYIFHAPLINIHAEIARSFVEKKKCLRGNKYLIVFTP